MVNEWLRQPPEWKTSLPGFSGTFALEFRCLGGGPMNNGTMPAGTSIPIGAIHVAPPLLFTGHAIDAAG